VDHVDGIGFVRCFAQPIEKFALIGVHRKMAEIDDLGSHGYVATEKFGLPLTVDQGASARSRRLKTDEDDRVARIGQALREVMEDASSSRHSGSRNDHRGSPHVADGLGGFDGSRLREVVRSEDIRVRSKLGSDLVVAIPDRVSVDLEGGERHRAVDVDRQRRDFPRFDELLELKEDDLRAIDRERRDHGDALSIDHPRDGFLEPLFGIAFAVFLVAVGRFDHDVVRVRRWSGWTEEGV